MGADAGEDGVAAASGTVSERLRDVVMGGSVARQELLSRGRGGQIFCGTDRARDCWAGTRRSGEGQDSPFQPLRHALQ